MDTITVEVQPPLKTLERSPFPAGLGQTLLFTATARGEDGSGLGRTTYVTATLATQEEDELLPFSSANPTAFTSTWTASRLVEPILGDAIYDVPVEGQDANGLRGTSRIGLWTDITPPGVPHLIDPSLPHPVNQATYPVKGTADPGSLVLLLVGATTYTATAGNELGVWEIPASLAAGPNSIRAKARDAAGNESPWSDPIILTLDQTPPGLATSVSPLWQRPSQPVTLTAVVTETDLLYWGDVWAAVSGPDPATRLPLTPPASQGGNPWQTTFLGGLEGNYSARLKARDRAGNTVTQTQTFILDGTPPSLAVTLSSAPPYGHVEGSTIYYGEGSGVFTVTAVATDTLSKLGQLIFPATTSSGQTYTYEGLTSQTQVHTYAFTTASTFSGNLTLNATDRAGNLTSEPFSVSYDNVAPTPPTITVPSAAPATFSLSWSGQDSGAGVRHYDVQVRDASTPTWTPWLTATTSTEAQFTGSPGHSYYFQVRATDQVNNTGAWQQAGPVAIRSVTKYYTFGSSRVAMRQGDEVYYLHGDHLGSTSLTTDGSGAVVAQSRYLPYGQERWSEGAAVTDFGFTGQRHEAGFGLMDYNARYYDPGLGRFVSADTVVPGSENPQAWNRYAYVYNNPLRLIDPSGHQGCPPEAPGCIEDPVKPLRDMWEYAEQQVKDTAYSITPLNVIKQGVPTVIGRKIDISVGVDAFFGQDIGGGVMIAFNWYSGELSLMPNVSTQASAGMPGGLSAGASDKLFVANGATSNDMLAGPANAFSGGLGLDAWGKVGIAGEYGWSVEDHWMDHGLNGPNSDELVITAIDPESKMPVTFGSLGVSVGGNVVANGIDARGGWSPGTNYTWNWVIKDLY